MTQPVPDEPGTPAPINRKAVYSIVFAVCAFACIYVAPFGGLVLGVPSVTTGIHARREIVESKGEQSGDSLAVIGLMIGAGAIVTVLLLWLLEGLD